MSSMTVAAPGVDQIRAWCENAKDDARIGLLRFTVRCVGKQFLIVRRDTGAMVRTSALGAEAVTMLAGGHQLGAVKAALGARYGVTPENVDLTPLLCSLAASQFITNLGGISLPVTAEPAWRRTWRIAANVFAERWMTFGVRRLPLPVFLPLLYSRANGGESAKRVEANLALAPALSLSPADRARIAQRNCELLARTVLDRFLLGTLAPSKLRCWFQRFITMSGAPAITNAINARKRVVLCGFHTGSYTLLPYALAAAGIPLTTLVNAPEAELAAGEQVKARLREAGLGADLKLVTGKTGIRTLAADLEHGRPVLIFPDAFLGRAGTGDPVPFLGRHIRPGAGLSWLCRRADVSIFPVHMSRQAGPHHLLSVHPEIPATPRDAGVTRRAYAELERLLLREPEQWLRWTNFHEMI